jgi:hypothetical protein
MDSTPSEKWTVLLLKAFLQARNRKASGNKAQLLERALLYVDEDEVSSNLTPAEVLLNEKRKIFEDSKIQWSNVISPAKIKLPDGFADAFDRNVINTFLTSTTYCFGSTGEEEAVSSGTAKPARKGRQLYASNKIQFCEVGNSDGMILFRCTMAASLKKEFRYACVAIKKSDGQIIISKCNCPQQADGKCSHVAALLYLVEDISLGADPSMSAACTSTQQTWHTGPKKKSLTKTPDAIHLMKYSKTKYRGDALIYYDPRPTNKRTTTEEEINKFVFDLRNLPKPCMWLDILTYQYEDYDIDQERQNVLIFLSNDLVNALGQELITAPADELSSESGVHFGNTVSQAASEIWSTLRRIRVTASIFQDFFKYPMTMTKKMLFDGRPDLSRVVAVQWGVENEENALKSFENEYGPITKVGLFVSKVFPFLGASPDGLWKGCVIEVKCPFILRDYHPVDIEKLSPSQQRTFCCEKVNGTLRLKKSHKYFWQVQCQLFVTGATEAKFII